MRQAWGQPGVGPGGPGQSVCGRLWAKGLPSSVAAGLLRFGRTKGRACLTATGRVYTRSPGTSSHPTALLDHAAREAHGASAVSVSARTAFPPQASQSSAGVQRLGEAAGSRDL